MTDIPTINNRSIVYLVPDEVDLDQDKKAARWRPDRGWCLLDEGDLPLEQESG